MFDNNYLFKFPESFQWMKGTYGITHDSECENAKYGIPPRFFSNTGETGVDKMISKLQQSPGEFSMSDVKMVKEYYDGVLLRLNEFPKDREVMLRLNNTKNVLESLLKSNRSA